MAKSSKDEGRALIAENRRARHDYFEWVYTHQYELNYLFDPVITVHPDEVFFEAFSRDESSYARLAAKYDLFEKIDEFECGTTNIDFSAKLHGELNNVNLFPDGTFGLRTFGARAWFDYVFFVEPVPAP